MSEYYLSQIDSIYAVLSMGDAGEGVVAFEHDGSWIPLIAADKTRLDELMPFAKRLAKNSRLRLVRFTTREEIMEIEP